MSTIFEKGQSAAETRKANPENFNVFFSGTMMRDPRRYLYVHSVAKRSFGPVSRILFPGLRLKGCENGERYVTCCTVPDPVPQASPDQERGGTRIDEHDGWRAVVDLLNPSNASRDPYAGSKNPNFFLNESGSNLIAEGLWPSEHKKPPEEEIRRAEQARDTHYRALTKEALRLAAISQRELNDYLQRYPDTHLAMDALGLEAAWHARNEVKAICPNCGDRINPGLAFHKSSADVMCIIDPAAAYRAGAITKERYEGLLAAEEETAAAAVAPQRGPGRRGQ